MRSLSLLPLLLLLLAAAQLSLADRERFRPYEILGVKRSASPEEIKKGYRRLVKELHPDKNKAPDAEDKFVRLTKAYELLSDPERRRMYDNHGVTEDTPNFNKKHDYSQYNRHGDPFDHLRVVKVLEFIRRKLDQLISQIDQFVDFSLKLGQAAVLKTQMLGLSAKEMALDIVK